MEALSAVIIGILSSLIATFVFLTLSWVFREIILPWYGDKIYRGVRVDGKWYWQKCNNTEMGNDASFEIVQKGDSISGIYSHKDTNTSRLETYSFKGNIRNTYLVASAWPTSKREIDAASFVLRAYSHNGMRMKGILTYISTQTGEVQTISVEFSHSENSTRC